MSEDKLEPCQHKNKKCLDSRPQPDGTRRRKYRCKDCGERVFTIEMDEHMAPLIEKTQAPGVTGWICPSCGGGNSPYSIRCPCRPTTHFEITYHSTSSDVYDK